MKNKFSEIRDDNFNILNIFFSQLFSTNSYYLLNKNLITDSHGLINIYKKINNTANLFDKLIYIDINTNADLHAIKKINGIFGIRDHAHYNIKTFIGCLLNADYKPNDEYCQIIKKLFGNTFKREDYDFIEEIKIDE
jgi:hypothetical protein